MCKSTSGIGDNYYSLPSSVVVLDLERLFKSDCGEAVVAGSHNGLSAGVPQ